MIRKDSENISILERVPFRWRFEVYLSSDPFSRVGEIRFIQVETKDEALEVASIYKWLDEIEQSRHPKKLNYSLTPQYK